MLVLDGNAWASAWEWVLASGSVALYVGVWSLHLMAELRPYVHYVPAAADLSDLQQQLEWILSHAHEAHRITTAAQRLHAKVASAEHSKRQCVHALAAPAIRTPRPRPCKTGESAQRASDADAHDA